VTQLNGRVDAYVIGGGPGGLATAAAMKQRGLHGVVLERSDGVGSSWRSHYDRLHLHTPRELSGLPGLPIPREMGRWVSRDDVVRYLELYARHHDLDVRTGAEVRRIDRAPADSTRDSWGDAWAVTLADGSTLAAPYAVVATGFNHTPREPDVPGLRDWPGEVVLARQYRNGSPYAGKDVLVVGTGNTGTELAVDLVEHGAARVRLAVRTIPHILRRNTGPYASQYTGIAVRHLPPALVDRAATVVERLQTPDLTAYGLPRPDTGLLTRVQRDNAIPVQDAGIIDAIRARSVEPVAALAAVDGRDVVLADGTRLRPDVLVLATGYAQGLEPMLGHLGVLDPSGRPLARGGHTAPGAPGLWFTGFTNPISGMLREMAIDARKIALAMAMTKRREVRARRRAA
jgi:putative flavoprotein involved in K+ transport